MSEQNEEIEAKASIRDGRVEATLTNGGATLTLLFEKTDQNIEEAVDLVLAAEDGFTRVLEALASAAMGVSGG